MKPILYGTAPSRAARPIWLLHEMGAIDAVDIRPVNFQKGEHKTPEFLKVNPLGQVPALIDGDFVLSESIAIMHYLLKRLYQEGRFVPFDNAQRSIYDSCLCLTSSDMDNYVVRVFVMKFFTPPDKRNESLMDYFKDRFIKQCVPILTRFLTDSEFLCGNQFTAADIVVGYTLHVANAIGWLEEHTTLFNYYLRLANRPAFQAALLTDDQKSKLPPPPPAPQTKARLYQLSTKPVLYTNPFSRGQRAVWLINECGLEDLVEIKMISIQQGEHKTPEYLKIHPGGVVPCLVDGDLTVTESAAIIQYLLRKFNKWADMAPFDLKSLALWDRVLYMTLGSVDNSILEAITFSFLTKLNILPPNDMWVEFWKSIWDTTAPGIELLVTDCQFSTGNKFQAVDCILGLSLSLSAQMLPEWLEPYPNIRAYVESLQQRKAYLQTWPKAKPKLFHDPVSRSNRVTWLLEESGLMDQIEIVEVKLAKGEHKKSEFLKINPAGQIPALVEPDGFTLSESVAICQYIIDKFDKTSEWIPTDPKLKAQCNRFLMITVGAADIHIFDAFLHILFVTPDKYDHEFINKCKTKWEQTVAIPLEGHLKDNEYITGDMFSLADLCLSFVLLTSERFGWHEKYPNISRYIATIMKRPAFRKNFPHKLEPIVIPPPKKEKEKEVVLPSRTDSSFNRTIRKNVIIGVSPIPKILVYHVPLTRSTRVLWLLKEIGGDVWQNTTVQQVPWEYLKTKDFFAINPNQLIPAVMIDDKPMFEAGAIIRYLCEVVASDLPVIKSLFPPTWSKENWSRHFIYSYWTIIHLDKEIISNFFGVSRIMGKLNGKVEKWFKKVVTPILEKDLGDNDYINGPNFTCTDIYVGYSLFLASNLGLFSKGGKIDNYFQRLTAREAFNTLIKQ